MAEQSSSGLASIMGLISSFFGGADSTPAQATQPTPMAMEIPEPKEKPRTPLNLNSLKNAIVQVETGGEKDPFIFTRESTKSSAFGPAQITYTLANEVLEKSPLSKNKKFNNYLEKYIQQGKDRINLYKENKKVPKYLAGGGKGRVSQREHDKYYSILFDEALKLKIKRAGEGNFEEIAKAWLGSKDKEKNQDYANKVTSFLGLPPKPKRKPKRIPKRNKGGSVIERNPYNYKPKAI